jgi:hypothetical protein
MLERKLPKLLSRLTEHARQSMLDCNGSTESEQESPACRAPAEGKEELMHSKSKPWTPEQDEALRKEVIAGASLLEVSEKLGRSEAAIKGRAYILRLSLRTIGVKRRDGSKWV